MQLVLGTAFAVGPAVLVTMGRGIVAITLFSLAVNMGAALIYLALALHLVRGLDPHAGPRWREIRARTLKFAGIVAVSRMQVAAVTQTSQLVVGNTQSAAGAGYFQVSNMIATRANDFLGRLATAIFPTGTQLLARGDRAAVRAMYLRTSRLLFVVNAGVTAGISVMAGPLLLYWIGPAFSDKGTVALVICMATQAAWAVTMSAGNLLLAAERPGLLLRYTVVGSAITLVALYPMSVRWGVSGAALAGLVGTVVVPFLLVHFHRSIVRVPTWQVVRQCYIRTLLGTSACALLGHYVVKPACHALLSTLVGLTGLILVCMVVSGLLGALTGEDVATMRRIALAVLRPRGSRAVSSAQAGGSGDGHGSA